MSLQTINIGNLANDGTGDDLRVAFIKVNNNFSTVSSLLDTSRTDGENIGTGEGLFAQKSDTILQFKSLHAGAGINISSSGNSVTINSDPTIKDILLITDNGSIIVQPGTPTVRLAGGKNTTTKVANGFIATDVTGPGLVALDPNPKFSGNVTADGKDITGAGTVSANKFVGPIEGLVYGIDIRDIYADLGTLDFGSASPRITSIIDFLIYNADFDLGTFNNPSYFILDGGVF